MFVVDVQESLENKKREKRLAFFFRCPLLLCQTQPSPVPPSEYEINRSREGIFNSILVLLFRQTDAPRGKERRVTISLS